MNNNFIKTMGPTRFLIGALVFLFPFLSLVTLFGVSLASFTFLIASLFFVKRGAAALRLHWHDIRWVVLAFAFNFIFALLCLFSPAYYDKTIELIKFVDNLRKKAS